jgi:HEPN domain-containing protein
MKRETRAWVKKAEADYRTAKYLARMPVGDHDNVCFHCQQCAEKYLKALMEEAGLPIPRIHDLERLRALLLPIHASLSGLRRGLLFLSAFAVEFRYPGEEASKRQAEAARRWSERVRGAARSLLGIREHRRKK